MGHIIMERESRKVRSPEQHQSAEKEFQLTGNILYLTKDPLLIQKQIAGEKIPIPAVEDLRDNVSTDEIIPAAICVQYTGREHEKMLGKHIFTGLADADIQPGDIQNGNFQVVVAGQSFGRGSSRMHAQVAHLEAGIQMVVADTERIFRENCINYGILTKQFDPAILRSLMQKQRISIDDITESYSPLSQAIIQSGGLLPFFRNLESASTSFITEHVQPRPMTMTEKIIAKSVIDLQGDTEERYVKPNMDVILTPHHYYGYELQTTITRATLEQEFGEQTPVRQPAKLTLFDDHTALLPRTHKAAQLQRQEQKRFVIPLIPHGATLFEANENDGVAGICHTVMLEEKALPGQLVLGNDSHTCTVGALNALAVGKGAADLAGAIAFDKMIMTVPESIRFNLHGKLRAGVTSKDFMLTLLAQPELKDQLQGSGRVFEYGGDGLSSMSFDEQIKLTNMAIEGQGFTGILEPTPQLVAYLKKQRNLSQEAVEAMLVYSDPDAEYAYTFDIDLSHIEPTVALPGDTQNGVPLSTVTQEHIKIQKAYIGSCTHGTPTDLAQAAEILKGKTIADHVQLFVQASSQKNLHIVENNGVIADLVKAGAILLPPGCGACMNAGPGSTEHADEVGIYATNRNFPGRTGKGKAYLASPAVVAASALKGTICGPEESMNEKAPKF
jgi:3-isopropylmalate/(R)-2-methylmalate dehydratase large subunit